MKKNGFTLIELLAVMAIIIIIVGLGAPTLINVLKNNKEKAQAKTIEIIESAARSYAIDYGESAGNTICISTLCSEEYLSCPINNAVTDTVMDGCVIITKDANNIESYNYNNSITESVMINLTIDLDGGSIETDPTDSYYIGSNITLTNPTKPNSTFAGWIVTSGNSTLSGNYLIMGTQNTTIKAEWTAWPELTLDLDDGITSQVLEESYAPEATIILETPTKPDYVFAGWTIISGNSTISDNDLTMGTEDTTIKALWADIIVEYAYTGNVQEFTVPVSATYKLEVWGASGGDVISNSQSSYGGYGGYSVAEKSFDKGDIIYIAVGEKGIDQNLVCAETTSAYNGGGQNSCQLYNGNYWTGSGGGGATHIATSSGELSTLESDKFSIIIEAGGGGAASGTFATEAGVWANGGSGGGYVGVDGFRNRTDTIIGYGGNQTEPGIATPIAGKTVLENAKFGQGCMARESYDGYLIISGGSGWYGGGCGQHTGGGGGSGYIGNTDLTNKSMYCYGCIESTETGIYTVNTTGTSSLRDTINCPLGYSADPISKCAKSGNGYAKITYVGSE